jgi:hypothetical protein
MIELKSDSLVVSVLDPVADKARLGTRYCTAGFIFQVEDSARGPLLAGPTYPGSYNLFDGQGAPDAFQPHLAVESAAAGTPSRVLGMGIGLIDQKANEVAERCAWDITQAEAPGAAREGGTLTFRTTQAAGGYRFHLERRLTLQGRTLRSATTVRNVGEKNLPFQWYPHPFFPLYPSGECCRLSVAASLPADSPGYELLDNGFLRMKHLPWKGDENHFQLIGHPGTQTVSFVQKHPVTSLVTAVCDYVPGRLPVWGNRRTFSFEPYYERNLSAGDTAAWSITYDF